MHSSKHIKLAAFTGLIVGLVLGMVDITARIIKLSFEWFEIYQALLIPLVIFVLGFAVLGLFVELLIKTVKLKVNEKKLIVFYAVSAVSLLLLFYGEIVMKLFLFPRMFTYDITRFFFFAFIIFFAVALIYVLLLTKGKELVFNVISVIKKKKVKKFLDNFVFMVGIFIIASFFLDIYLLKNIPVSTSNIELEGYPNILFIVLDSLRADHLSLYGYPLDTSPNLDKFAKDSVVFDNAVSAGAFSLTSHASFFTGKYPFHHKATKSNQKLDDKETTLAEILRAKGYNTAGFVGSVFLKAKYGFAQGFNTYKSRADFFEYMNTYQSFNIRSVLRLIIPGFERNILNTDGHGISEEMNRDIFKWLGKNKAGPFYMFINYMDVHEPYDSVGKEFRKYFTNETVDYREIVKATGIKRHGNISEDLVNHMVGLYDAEIFYLDRNLQKLFDKLDELGIKNNTIIIITSDHGEEFYEHGGFGHSATLYEEVIHVPFIVHYPKEFIPQRIEERVEIISILPTVLDVLNMAIPEDIDGASLVPLIKNTGEYKRRYAVSQISGRPYLDQPDQYSISDGSWKLIEVSPEKEDMPSSLFNLKTDPQEQNNLYDTYAEKRKLLQESYQLQVGD